MHILKFNIPNNTSIPERINTMQYGYNKKTINSRWPFPVLHTFNGERSSCGKASKEKMTTISDNVPKGLFVVCELCVYGKPTLREAIYNAMTV